MTLTEYGIITALKPIAGGWRFVQMFAGKPSIVTPEMAPEGHYATDGDRLVAAVKLYRENQRIPVGDPAFDVAAFIRRVSPANDYYRGNLPATFGSRVLRETRLIDEMRDWIKETTLRKPDMILSIYAKERALVCKDCPHNVAWRSADLEKNKLIEYDGHMLRAVTDFPDAKLRACGLYRFYLPAAVFLDQDFFPERNPKSPDNCWII